MAGRINSKLRLKTAMRLLHGERKPKEGTYIREIYDRLVDVPLSVVVFAPDEKPSKYGPILERLRIEYGLDIRLVVQRQYVCYGTNTRDFLAESLAHDPK